MKGAYREHWDSQTQTLSGFHCYQPLNCQSISRYNAETDPAWKSAGWVSGLTMETGTQRPSCPENRDHAHCVSCGIETELHVLLHCQKYQHIRKTLSGIITHKIHVKSGIIWGEGNCTLGKTVRRWMSWPFPEREKDRVIWQKDRERQSDRDRDRLMDRESHKE